MMRYDFLIFYLSTFLSSIGSLVFQICLIGFMMKGNFSLFEISLVVGFSRLSTVFCQFYLGDIGDKFSPRKILIITEIICILLSYAILDLWNRGEDYFWLFIVFSSLRSSLIAVQSGPRGKITKLFSDPTIDSNIKTATWLNKVTHGTFFIAAFMSLYFLENLTFKEVIYLDMATFLVGGVLLFFIEDSTKPAVKKKESLFTKFVHLFKYSKVPAIYDLLLALSVTGLNMLTVRIVSGDSSKVPYFYAIYGLCVWLSGFLKNSKILKEYNFIYWLGMFVSYILISQFIGTDYLFLGVLFLYYSYWSVFHLITASIQKEAPPEYISGIVSARNVLMLTVIALGEFVVGFVFSEISVATELYIRGIFCLFVGILAIRHKLV